VPGSVATKPVCREPQRAPGVVSGDPLEPIPATEEAFRFLGGSQEGLEAQVRDLAERVREVVPATVGVSLSFVEPAVTFTLAVSAPALLPLDAVQYLEDGPCVAAVRDDELIHVPGTDPLDERRWSLFARTSAQLGIRSSLTVPVHLGDQVVGGLNVYAAEQDAFEGRAEQVAALVQAPASEAVRDADLTFASRGTAEETVRTLQNQVVVDVAAGVLAEREGIPVEEAVARLEQAAAQAGLPLVHLAQLLIELRDEDR
jgi:GAF domain-containing protein